MSNSDSKCKLEAGINQEKLKILKSMCLKVDWQIENERRKCLRQLEPLISDWQGQLPNLRDIFRKDEIDWLLLQSVIDVSFYDDEIPRFIEFVARSGYKDEPDLDRDGKPILRRTTAVHQAYSRAVDTVIPTLFKIYDRFDVNYTDDDGLTHFHIACRHSCCFDVVEKFLELRQDPNCLWKRPGFSPLYLALRGGGREIMLLLLKYGADPTWANVEGRTFLHWICNGLVDDDDFVKILFEISEEKHRQLQIDVQDVFGFTPLYVALENDNIEIAKLLLERGADPNLGLFKGHTALQLLCMKENGVVIDKLSLFFEMCDRFGKPVEVNARSPMSGRTALHWAMENGNFAIAGLLLRKGANPNLADINGYTSLHIFCMKPDYESDDDDDIAVSNLMEMLMEVRYEYGPLQINAQNKEGDTPLHLAVKAGDCNVINWLLKNGVDLNLANKKGFTPLHILCKDFFEGDGQRVRMYFEICDKLNRPVLVDAKDNEGLTPLHWAVANFFFNAVDELLDHGADLSNFVFPNESCFAKESEMESYKDDFIIILVTKLRVATQLLPVINRLVEAGYELDWDNKLAIVTFFVKYEVFEKSRDLEEYNWLDDEEFLATARNIMVKPDLSFYDAIQLPPREAAVRLERTDYCDVADTFEDFRELPERQQKACVMHLCEKATRRLFQRWALNPFWKLIHHRLPIECCDMILDNLKNEDLCNICLAGVGQS
uniref:Uncharacterized protein n=1 Tax=Trichogramma kaykai TaxID=54128 RepID=A0ABD2WW11_9HYME